MHYGAWNGTRRNRRSPDTYTHFSARLVPPLLSGRAIRPVATHIIALTVQQLSLDSISGTVVVNGRAGMLRCGAVKIPRKSVLTGAYEHFDDKPCGLAPQTPPLRPGNHGNARVHAASGVVGLGHDGGSGRGECILGPAGRN